MNFLNMITIIKRIHKEIKLNHYRLVIRISKIKLLNYRNNLLKYFRINCDKN